MATGCLIGFSWLAASYLGGWHSLFETSWDNLAEVQDFADGGWVKVLYVAEMDACSWEVDTCVYVDPYSAIIQSCVSGIDLTVYSQRH